MKPLPATMLAALILAAVCTEASTEISEAHQIQPENSRKVDKPDSVVPGVVETDATRPLSAPLDISVPAAPWAFRVNNKWNLVYELHVANIGSDTCTLKQVVVHESGGNAGLLRALSGKNLEGAIAHSWVNEDAPAVIKTASIAVIFMWVRFDGGGNVPAAISHTITMRVGSYPEDLSITMPPLSVTRKPVPVIGPPLRGSDWGAAHGPGNDSTHRRGLLTIEGRSYIAERYAIDWLQITAAGDVHTGEGNVNEDFPGYGADVIAVADGTITEVIDEVPENIPGKPPAVPITLKNICGNHVIEQIGDNLYASYCHLQVGLKVTAGARVKRGQLLGHVGNTGSSDAPHLHFHLCNANSTLACEGVPYAFATFGEEHKDFSSASGAKSHPETMHSMELPTDETLVDFPKSGPQKR